MKHDWISEECRALGLEVRQTPDPGGARSFEATGAGVRVYWRTSNHSLDTLGLPRVASRHGDTHARSLREIRYLVERR